MRIEWVALKQQSMVNFFRRIRQALFNENKYRKYTFYAIGEIALVMIGILLALQVNNWNSNRIEKKEEQFIYLRLIQDLKQDVEGLQTSIDNFEQRLIFGAEALEQLESENLDLVRSWASYKLAVENKPHLIESKNLPFGSVLFRILIIDLYYPTDNTFQELIASSKIDLISNDELKAMIQAYYPAMKRRQHFQDNIIFTVQSNYRDALDRNNISYLNTQSLKEMESQGVDKKDLEAAIENLLSLTRGSLRDDPDIISLITMKRQVKELIRKIEAEVKVQN